MAENETLVVASKVKAYIKATSSLKCSSAVAEVLSDRIREMCDNAVQKAKDAKRKTVQNKDFNSSS